MPYGRTVFLDIFFVYFSNFFKLIIWHLFYNMDYNSATVFQKNTKFINLWCKWLDN